METAENFSEQKKEEEYVENIQATLEEYEQEIKGLKAEAQSGAAEMEAESKARLDESLEALENKKQAAAAKLDELKSAGDHGMGDRRPPPSRFRHGRAADRPAGDLSQQRNSFI